MQFFSVNHSFILWPTHLIFLPVRLFPMCFCQGFNFLFSVNWKDFKGGAVVRAPASHQCDPGSNPGVDAIWRLSLLLVLSLAAPRGFLRALRFSPFLETQHFLFPIRPRMADEKPLRKCATSKIVLYYLFILLTLVFIISFGNTRFVLVCIILVSFMPLQTLLPLLLQTRHPPQL